MIIFCLKGNDCAIDTTSASGGLVFNIFASMAQFEQTIIQERRRTGLKAARARGKAGGRKAIEADNKKVILAKKLHVDNDYSINDICHTLDISRATLYRYINIK